MQKSLPSITIIAPCCDQPSHDWFSPGRSERLHQLFSIIGQHFQPVYLLNTAPSATSLPSTYTLSLCHSSSMFRFYQIISSLIFAKFNHGYIFSSQYLWVYNCRFQESLIVFFLFLCNPSAKLILEIEDLPSARIFNSRLKGWLDLFCLRSLALFSFHTFTVSSVVNKRLLHLCSINKNKTSILPPMLSDDYLNVLSKRKPPFSSSPIRIIYAGGYSSDKGVNDLLKAFLRLPTSSFELILVGPIPSNLSDSLLPFPHIITRGYVCSQELYAIYSSADIVISPHRPLLHSDYVFPFKLIEYVSSGALPLLTPMPGCEYLDLPSDCFYTTVDQLYHKILNSCSLWSLHSNHLRDIASKLRSTHSTQCLSKELASLINVGF